MLGKCEHVGEGRRAVFKSPAGLLIHSFGYSNCYFVVSIIYTVGSACSSVPQRTGLGMSP